MFFSLFLLQSSDKTSLYILDCMFSVFVIGTLVVFVWRGAWVLLDIFLFPEDITWSSWVSLVSKTFLKYVTIVNKYLYNRQYRLFPISLYF